MSRNTKKNKKKVSSGYDKKDDAKISESEIKEDVEKPDGKNDPRWYDIIPQLTRDAARIPWSWAMGMTLPVCTSDPKFAAVASGTNLKLNDDTGTLRNITPNSSWSNVDKSGSALPGLVTLYTKSSLGYELVNSDPINTLAQQFYTQLRYANSGKRNYEPADAVIYLLAVQEIYAFVSWCRKLYDAAFVYSQQNFYWSEDILKDNLVDPNDFKMHLADFRAWLNTFIMALDKYRLPTTMTYVARKVFMYRNVYIENPYGNIRDQLYQFAPGAFYMFDLHHNTTNTAAWGRLISVPLQSSSGSYTRGAPATASSGLQLTVADIEAYGKRMMDCIRSNGEEDFALISGDIARAYGQNTVSLELVPEEGGLLPVFDPYVLSQMKNATIVGTPNYDDASTQTSTTSYVSGETYYYGDLDQDPNTGKLWYGDWLGPKVNSAGCLGASMAKVLSVENPEPGEGDVMEATRCTVGARSTSAAGGVMLSGATDLVVSAHITRRGYTALNFDANVINPNDYMGSVSLFTSLAISAASCKYMPMLYGLFTTTPSGSTSPLQVDAVVCLSNVDNYTMVSNDEIMKLHRAAMFNMLYVPSIAKSLNS